MTKYFETINKTCGCEGCGHSEAPKSQDGGQSRLEKLGINKIQLGLVLAGTILFIMGFVISPLFFALSYVVTGHSVVIRAIKGIFSGRILDEFTLMTVATVGAFSIGEPAEAVAVMLFFSIGEMMQDAALNHSRSSIAALVDLKPEHAWQIIDGAEVKVSSEKVPAGSVIAVKVGEQIPLDSVLINESAVVDNAAITGESLPVNLKSGDHVPAGAVLQVSGALFKTTKVYSESTIARIIDMVENAKNRKTKTENMVTRFAKYYTPAVVGLMIFVSFGIPLLFGRMEHFTTWLHRGLMFLVISCPCAVVISVPLGFFAGIGRASSMGILFKGSNTLDALSQIDRIAFDKTGTLTEGVFSVVKVHGESERLHRLAMIAESQSVHPVATSVMEYAQKNIEGENHHALAADYDTKEIAGLGTRSVPMKGSKSEGEILAGSINLMNRYGISVPIKTENTAVYIAEGDQFIGCYELSDSLRVHSKSAIKDLGGQCKISMLTGDKQTAAEKTAGELQLQDFHADLLPEDKHRMVESWQQAGETVMFVGDGINDAPVLAQSDIGVSMGLGGSDTAITASDMVLMGGIEKIAPARKISKFTKQIVLQNILFAMITKITVMILATTGFANMWMAIIADVGVTVLAILNSLRVLVRRL